MSNLADYIIVAGLPGSGKTRLAQQLKEKYEAVVLASDDYKHIETDADGNEVRITDYERMKDDAVELLEKETPVIVQASCLTEKRRRFLLRGISSFRHKKTCYLTLRSYAACMRDLEERGSSISLTLQDGFYRSFEAPYYCEGWDDIFVIYPDDDATSKGSPEGYYERFMNYDQDTPYHQETLGEHMKMTGDHLLPTNDPELIAAGYLHDIGKPFSRTYTDAKGRKTEAAHYFGHAGIGAYESLFFDMGDLDKLRIAWLISQHMKPLEWRRSGSKSGAEKARKRWGEDLWHEIQLLAEADDASKISSIKTG
ncbi:MAG: AAA family ATPase [Erysipelotrichaceae bacterium]|nr:AAA family ATPase [Erysipelotrichaceae bacterium]